MLTIIHTRADGTLIDGTARGDGTGPILKANGWRWSRNLSAWYVPASRDRSPSQSRIEATVQQLSGAGHQVTVTLDDTPRPTTDVEADRADRARLRADTLTDRTERLRDRAAVADRRAHRAGQAVPPGGEPIKVGHHSEASHRRALERAHTTLSASVEADRAVAEAERQADVAASTTQARHGAVTVANRLQRLEADRRRALRSRDGHSRTVYRGQGGAPDAVDTVPAAAGELRDRLEQQISELDDQIAHWSAVRDAQQATSQATSYGPHNVSSGDQGVRRDLQSARWWGPPGGEGRALPGRSDDAELSVPLCTLGVHQRADRRP